MQSFVNDASSFFLEALLSIRWEEVMGGGKHVFKEKTIIEHRENDKFLTRVGKTGIMHSLKP